VQSKAEQKRDRLAKLLAAKAAGELDYPLSWAQERMWFLTQLESDGAYNLVSSSRIGKALDPELLASSFTAIVQRHAALRTIFPIVAGRPMQRVLTDVAVPVHTVDLASGDPSRVEDEARELVERETTRPFDLATGPLLRVTLARLGESESLLIIAVHHIAIDGWSFDILLRELNTTYRALSFGAKPELPELEIQYPDWSRWQRRWLSEARMAGQLAYWKSILEGAPPLLDWPADRPRPARRSGQGAAHQTQLVDPLTSRLLDLGGEEQATPFMTVLAAYLAFLRLWTGETDLVVGTPVANRPRAELHDLIGLFLNTLALRVRCEEGVTFRRLLRRTRDATLGALLHQDVPFERLVEDLRPIRDLSHTPIFQTMFVLRSAEPGYERAAIGGAPPVTTSKFDFSINAFHTGDVVDLLWEYSTDLFDEETVVGLSEVFPRLVEAACAEPDRALDDLHVDDGGLGLLAGKTRADSKLTFLGFRIDPSLVAESIGRVPGVRDVHVDVRPGRTGEPELVAEVTAVPGAAVSGKELRQAAAAELPAYMVPTRVLVDAFAADVEEPAALDASLTEARLKAIWEEILGLEDVGRDDNFFELGGHSIAAAQVVARVRDSFEQELPLRTIFESPTIAELAAALSEGALVEGLPLVRVPRARNLPLSFAQERLWFLAQLDPESTAYNVPAAHWIDGPVDPRVLERALDWLVARHEVLRTTYPSADGRPTQRIHPHVHVPLQVFELGELPVAEALAEARRLSDVEADRPFDLAEGPLIRAALIRLRPTAHLLLLTVHHIAVDAWSVDLLFRELDRARVAFGEGRRPDLAELDVQYADWAHWQRQSLTGDRLAALLDYWRTALDGAPRALDLPTDHPQRGRFEPRGATFAFWLEPELRRRIELVSQEHRVTPFMTILAALAFALRRWSGHDDLVVGAPVACRTSAVIERLVGLFVNTLPLRVRVRRDDTFASLLARVRETTLGALAHQDLPFERLVEELRPERSLSRNPLFQILLVVQNNPRHWTDEPRIGVDAQPAPPPGGTAKFDLSFFVTETADRYRVGVEYACDLFERSTIERLSRRLTTILEAALGDLDAPLESAPVADAAELATLREWSAGAPAGEAPTVVDRVLAQAEATPDVVAVTMGGESLTYAALVAGAYEVAARLEPHVHADRPVGLCVERAPRGVAAMLGILLGGGAYLPLDPAYPRPRLEEMLVTARPTAAVVETATRDLLLDGLPAVDLASGGPAGRTPRRSARHAPDQLCYVMFTSGSRGAPKGVAVTHRVLANLVDWQIRRSALEAGAVTAQFAPWTFDVSAQEIFAALCAGGSLAIVGEDERHDPALLWRLVRDAGVQRLFLPPAALYAFAASAPAVLPETLTELDVAGETLVVDADLADLLARARGLRLSNQYGPLETHVVAEHAVSDLALRLPPIGRPIPGATTHVLDDGLRPAPIGVAGELYVGGRPVGRGYVNRPDLTAERFLPDPFAAEPGGRLYRTGDLARWRYDGSLELLGRADDQLKVRGFRIEPGEVEAAIREHPGVAAAVVTVRGERLRQSLCASVVPADGVPVDPSALRRHLRSVLPEHLVPSVVLSFDELPLTPSGKVDRRAAAALAEATDPAPTGVPVRDRPQTPLELELAEIWSEVLNVSAISPGDDFFDRGGHSLLATQVVARIASRLGVEISLRTLFEQPTLRDLALAVTEAGGARQAGAA
jgi:amino acid adenylation domain-containing protein